MDKRKSGRGTGTFNGQISATAIDVINYLITILSKSDRFL
jgi:hypothetical protein